MTSWQSLARPSLTRARPGLGGAPDIPEEVYQAVHDSIWEGCDGPAYDCPLIRGDYLCDADYTCPDGYRNRIQCTLQDEGFVCTGCGWVVMPGPVEWACAQAMWFCSGICGAPGYFLNP